MAIVVDARLKSVQPVTYSVTARQTRSDRTNSLLETKTFGGQCIGSGRLHVRKSSAAEYVMGMLIVEKNRDIHKAVLLRET